MNTTNERRNAGIRILSTGRALPARMVSNDEMSSIVETSDEWIRTRTGIRNRYYCGEETGASLAIEAGRLAIERARIEPASIGAVLVANSMPDYAVPSTACLVQEALGLQEEIIAYDISAGCTGFLMGLQTAAGLFAILSEEKNHILLIGSEQLSRVMDFTDRGTCILFGDGAGAVVLERSERLFAAKSWSRGNKEVLSCKGPGQSDAKIRMKGNDVFKFAVTVLPQAIDETLQKAGKKLEDVDLIICHQANERIICLVQKKYPGQEEKFYMNIARYGNTSGASIPIALDELMEQKKLRPGMTLLLAGFGAGLTWSAAILST